MLASDVRREQARAYREPTHISAREEVVRADVLFAARRPVADPEQNDEVARDDDRDRGDGGCSWSAMGGGGERCRSTWSLSSFRATTISRPPSGRRSGPNVTHLTVEHEATPARARPGRNAPLPACRGAASRSSRRSGRRSAGRQRSCRRAADRCGRRHRNRRRATRVTGANCASAGQWREA